MAREHPLTIIDAIRMSERDLQRVLSGVETGSAGSSGVERPAAAPGMARTPLRMCDPIAQSCAIYLIKPREIRRDRLVFLHGAFAYEGSECVLLLWTRDGRPAQLPCVVTNSRHLAGRIHEVTARFDQSIEPGDYLLPDGTAITIEDQQAEAPSPTPSPSRAA